MKLSESDYQQLELLSSSKLYRTSPGSVLKRFWQLFVQYMTERQELQIWHTYDRSGQLWWNAYDPSTGRSICLQSKEQILVWIEQRNRDR